MGKEMKKIILSILILISPTFSDIIHVPDDQQTIQMGIVFAANGDTVLVAPGTYTGTGNKDIDFYGKSITLLSENGWENTTIDLEDNGRAFYFHLNEDSTSVINGFRIYNGYVPDDGGGIYIENSLPKILNSKIEGCYAGDDAGKGGGFFINTNGGLIIENTIIEYCGHNTQTDKGGGGYVFEGSLIVRNSIFRNNYMDFQGGGLYLSYTSTPTHIYGSSFQNNGYYDQSSGGNGIYTEDAQLILNNTSFIDNNGNGSGGAIFLESGGSGNSYINNCQFISNGRNLLGGHGGAIFYSGGSDSLFITSSLFKDNIVSNDNGYGGAIYSYGYINLVNCEVTNNTAFRYPGIYTNNIEVNFSTITNNTNNDGNLGGHADIYFFDSNFQSILTNSIIDSYSNYGSSAPLPYVENIFNDGATAVKFIDQDHGDYRINIHSPCIGMGSLTEIQYDLAGNPRTNPPGSSPDVGCYEHALANTISDPVGIYISPNGNDTLSTGMINNPFASLSFAVNNLIDYDTIYVNPGNYNDNKLIQYNSAHISTIGLGDVNEVTFNLQTDGFIYSTGLNEFRNLTVQTQNDSLMYIGSGCSFENLVLESDIYGFGNATSISMENVILNGTINLNYFDDSYNICPININNSEFHNMYINVDPDYTGYTNNKRIILNLNNCIFNNLDDSGFPSHDGANNILFFVTNSRINGGINLNSAGFDSSNWNVISNCVIDNGSITIYKDDQNGVTRSVYNLFNCTFYNSTISTDCAPSGDFKNIIFFPDFSGIFHPSNSEHPVISYSMNAPDSGPGNIFGDPLLRDPANGDFSLFPASQCIDAGSPFDELDPDSTRTDMGAIYFNQNGEYEPQITSIIDIPDDQGGALRIYWNHSPLDIEFGNITHYGIRRLLADGDTDLITQVPAFQDESYQFVASTLMDSVSTGNYLETYVISAHTSNPWIYYVSDPVSGYSVDNIAPLAPYSLTGHLIENGGVELRWDQELTEDFQYFNIYREGMLIASTPDTMYLDYSIPEMGIIEYHVTATDYHENESLASVAIEVEIMPLQSQQITLSQLRWNNISFNLEFLDNSITSVFNESEILAINDDAGNYFIPSINVNSLENLQIEKGYHVFTNSSFDLNLITSGYPIDLSSYQIELIPLQFNNISYLPTEPMSVESVMANLPISLIRDSDGHYYLPDFGVNSIDPSGGLQPGKGYEIFITGMESVIFNYPEPTILSRYKPALESREQYTQMTSQHYQITPTGISKPVIIKSITGAVKSGDEIAVFANGDIVGASRIVDADSPILVTVWEGFHNYSIDLPGFKPSDEIEIRLWKSSENREANVIAELDVSYFGQSLLITGTIVVNDQELIPEKFTLHPAYPNPFNPVTTINYAIPHDAYVEIKAFDVRGKEVAELVNGMIEEGNHEVVWDASKLSSGMYFVRMISGDFNAVQKLIFLK